MPSWKKVVASGSDASFSSVSVDTYVSASSFKGSFTGSLEGTASQAISSSYALTASYALFAANGGGGGISAIYIQDEGITQGTASYFNFYGAGVTATVSDSTASINIPGGGGGTTNNAENAVLNQSSPAVTWSFTHNLGAKYPVFTVFDSSDNVIIPQQIHAVDTSSALIYFSTARTGTAVASVAGNVLTSSYSISSSYAYTASSAVSASFAFTASSANSFNVRNSLTASGLRYPTADGTYASQVLQTDASGNLSFGDVQTTFDNIYNGEATTLVKGTPVYISGSNGANPKVFRADAADANKMPVTYIVSENIAAGNTGRGITLGHIEGIDLTGYPAGTSVYINSGGGWTSTRPTGSNVTIQFLGLVTKEGSGGKGLVLNPGPVVLPNIQSGYTWVGNGNSYPVAVTTSSLLVTSASYAFTASSAISSSLAQTASYVLNAVSSSYAYTASSAINASSSLIAVSASYAATSSYATNFTASNILVTGTITAQTLVVSTISSSVAYSSGSNIFGNSTSNTQTFTGSVNITGSLNLNGKATLTDLTGSLFGTASWAQNSSTASYVLNAVSSSYAYTASSAVNAATLSGTGSVGFTTTASFNAVSSSQQDISASLLQMSSSYISLSGSYNVFSGSISTRVTTISSSQQDISSSLLQVSASYISLSGSYNTSSGSFSTRLTTVSSSQQDISSSQQQISASLLIISRSYATTGSNNFTSNQTITGSLNVSDGITGSLQGTSSWAQNAVTSSYALTASYALNAGGGGLSALFIADEGITQGTASYINFTGAGVTATVSAGTASINITGGGSGISGLSTTFTQSVASNTWTFIHNLNTRYPLIQVYDTTYNQIVPQFVSSSTADTVIIGFGVATAGYAVASNGGTLYVTGSNVILDQVAAATTWSFNHNLNTQYPIFQVFDSNNEVMIPQRIVATDATSSLFYFPFAVTGKAVASVGGISGSMGSGVGFPFSGSAVITGSFLVSQSFVDFSKTTGVSGSFTGSLFGTASYATFALSSSFAPGFTTNMSQSVAATTWSFTHNLNTINPIVQVYDLTNSQIIPNQIVGMNNSTAEIRFDYAQVGYAVASNGGGLYVTGSTSTLVQNSGAVTWSFTHNLNNKYNTYEVYDSNDTVIIPSGIKALTNNTAELYFSGLQTGRAVAQFSGINGAPNATTASYALTATSSSYAATASYLNPITNSYVVLTQVSQSLNFVDDTAAAAGGVPLGGIYRNGNFILIRLS